MMTPLEKFNEEVMKEFDKIYMPLYVQVEASVAEDFDVRITKFITQKLTEHKSLILRMVREGVPEEIFGSSPEASAWNECRQEFLNNLDTI